MARAPKKPAPAAELPVLTEVPDDDADLPVLTDAPDPEPTLPVLTEVLADDAHSAAPAPAPPAAESQPAGKIKSAASGEPTPANRPAPASMPPPERPPAAAREAAEPAPAEPAADPKPQTVQLTDEQLRKIAAYVAPEVEKLLRKKVSTALDALWPKIWAEADAQIPEMIRNIIIDLTKHTRK